MPSAPTMKLPLRKSPCTSAASASRARRVLVEPAQPELERRVRLVERVENSALLVELRRAASSTGSGGSALVSTAWMRAAIVPHCAARRRPGRVVLGVAEDAARDRLALDPVHEEARRRARRRARATPARAAPARRPGRPPRAARTRSPRSAALAWPAGSRRSTSRWTSPARVGRVERPGLAGRPAREPAEPVRPRPARRRSARRPGRARRDRERRGPRGDATGRISRRSGPVSAAPAADRAHLHDFSTGPCRLLHARSLSSWCEQDRADGQDAVSGTSSAATVIAGLPARRRAASP